MSYAIEYTIESVANAAITAVFNAMADDRGAITAEQYSAFASTRDSILATHGIALVDYLAWCEDQENAG